MRGAVADALRLPYIIRLERKHDGRLLPYEMVAERIADYLRESGGAPTLNTGLVTAARIEGIELAGADALRVH